MNLGWLINYFCPWLLVYRSEYPYKTYYVDRKYLCAMPLQEIFEGSISGYDVKIILNSEGLVIFLWNPHKRRCYQARIPYLLEGKSLQIQNIFVNLDEFFIYLTQFSEDRDRISINQKGTIKVSYIVKKSKKLTPPIVYIDTEVLVTGAQMKDEPKLHREISDVRRQNLLLQNKINQLMKLSENNLKQIEQLKTILNKKDTRYSDSSESEESMSVQKPKKRKKKYSVVSGGKSSLLQLNSTVKQLGRDLQVMRQRIKKGEKKPKKHFSVNPAIQDIRTEEEIFGTKMDITVDDNNKYLHSQFQIEGNKITKIKAYGRYQILSKEVVPPFGRHYFVIFLERISYQIFSLGIVNQKRRNYQNSYMSPELISYFGKTGAIWQHNDQFPCRTGGPKIPSGVEIRVAIDMNRYMVFWFMDRKEIASTTIKQHLRGQRMVAYLQINYCGDTVYLNQRGPSKSD